MDAGFVCTRSRVNVIYDPQGSLSTWTRFRYSYYDSDENL